MVQVRLVLHTAAFWLMRPVPPEPVKETPKMHHIRLPIGSRAPT
jgi:hypothetical protein